MGLFPVLEPQQPLWGLVGLDPEGRKTHVWSKLPVTAGILYTTHTRCDLAWSYRAATEAQGKLGP